MIYTTYFARLRSLPKEIVPISIALYPPKNWNGLSYPKLAPYPYLLRDYKNNPDHTAKYFSMLSEFDPDNVVRELFALANGATDIALVCYEQPSDFCYRQLAAKWLNASGYNVEEFDFAHR